MKHEIKEHEVLILKHIQHTIHQACVDAGWYNDLVTDQPVQRNTGEVIALMHSELSEALEGWRKNLMDDHLPHRQSIEVEFADAVIRIFDTSGAMGLDLAGAIQEKFAYNQTRADHKRENRLAEGGKKI
jgi:NTP pyrophosphatase (non-canonical NTP hydrolase)